MSDIKYMDISEFRKLGFLQEVNRLFFHPHGLALEVQVDEDGTETLRGIWDCRDDPEGIHLDSVDIDKAQYVDEHFLRRAGPRHRALGFIVQPYVVQPTEEDADE